MAHFQFFVPVNVHALTDFLAFNGANAHLSPTKVTLHSGSIDITITGQGFALGPNGPTGTVNTIEVDRNNSVAYKFTGLSASVNTLANDFTNHQLTQAFNLLAQGNDTIVDSNTDITHGPSKLAGGPGDDTFVFHAGFGQVEIFDFTPGTLAHHDKINLHAVPGLANLAQVKALATYDSHHFVVIHDMMGDSITLDHVKSIGLLHGFDFHF